VSLCLGQRLECLKRQEEGRSCQGVWQIVLARIARYEGIWERDARTGRSESGLICDGEMRGKREERRRDEGWKGIPREPLMS
jgi:hypothetical protein